MSLHSAHRLYPPYASAIKVILTVQSYYIIIAAHYLSAWSRHTTTQSRIIGAVRGAHSQLWGTIIPVCSLYAARKYDSRFGTPAIV